MTPAVQAHLLLTIEEAAQALRCSRSRVFELLADGTLARGVRYGRRVVITAESVQAALEAPPPEAPRHRRRTRASKTDLAAQFAAVLANARVRR